MLLFVYPVLCCSLLLLHYDTRIVFVDGAISTMIDVTIPSMTASTGRSSTSSSSSSSASNSIVYDIAYMRNGGIIDLSDLLFTAKSFTTNSNNNNNDDDNYRNDDDNNRYDMTSTTASFSDSNGVNYGDDDMLLYNDDDTNNHIDETPIDSLFQKPIHSNNNVNEYGIGYNTDDDEVYRMHENIRTTESDSEYESETANLNLNSILQEGDVQLEEETTLIDSTDYTQRRILFGTLPTLTTTTRSASINGKHRKLIPIQPRKQQEQQNKRRRLFFSSLFEQGSSSKEDKQTNTVKTTTNGVNTNNIVPDETIIDIAIFPISKKCSESLSRKNVDDDAKSYCYWQQLGIGVSTISSIDSSAHHEQLQQQPPEHNEHVWCCNDETIQKGLCTKESYNYGRLLINNTLYNGQRRMVSLSSGTIGSSSSSSTVTSMLYSTNSMNNSPIVYFPKNSSSSYIIMYANCGTVSTKIFTTTAATTTTNSNTNTQALITPATRFMSNRVVTMSGDVIWKSKHGYLPGELYGFFMYYKVLCVLYCILLVWFVYEMYKYTSSRIRVDVEYYICYIILLSMSEVLFRLFDYTLWNNCGVRNNIVLWCTIIINVIKETFSRCIILFISMGYTICRSSESMEYKILYTISCIGIIYVFVSLVSSFLLVIATKNMYKFSYNKEIVLINIVSILNYIQYTIELAFIVSLYVCINNTILYLHRINDTIKLIRLQNLRIILIASGLYLLISYILLSSNSTLLIVNEQYTSWFRLTFIEINSLIVLVCIAILWKPNQYSYNYIFYDNKKSTDTSEIKSIPSTISTTTTASSSSSKVSTTKQRKKEIQQQQQQKKVYNIEKNRFVHYDRKYQQQKACLSEDYYDDDCFNDNDVDESMFSETGSVSSSTSISVSSTITAPTTTTTISSTSSSFNDSYHDDIEQNNTKINNHRRHHRRC